MGVNDVRYVNGAPGKGQDNPNPPWGLSAQFPWATIQFGVDELAKINGGALFAAVAEYRENVQMRGAKYSGISVVGTPGGSYNPEIPDQYCEARPQINGQQKDRVFTIEDATGVALKNLSIHDGKHDDGGGVGAKNSQVDLIECCIHHNIGKSEGGGGFAYIDCKSGACRVEKCLVFSNTAEVSSVGATLGSIGGLIVGAIGGFVVVGGVALWVSKNPLVGGGFGVFGGIIGGGIGYQWGGSLVGSATAGKGRGGGGLIWKSDNIAITKSKFWDNTAEMVGGGALCLDGASKIAIEEQNVFHDNKATLPSWQQGRGFGTGGAVLMQHCEDAPATISIATQNKFEKNDAQIRGGAIGIQDNSYVVISDQNVFDTNHAGVDGGAIAIIERFEPPYTGGVDIMGEKLASRTVEIYDSTFATNKADKGGGAIYASASSYLIVGKCQFASNNADTEGGAIHASVNSAIESRGNGFAGNTCNGTGGAISTRNCHVFVSGSNAFNGNVSGSYGGGIHFYTAEEGAFGRVLDQYLANAGFVTARLVVTGQNAFAGNQAVHGGGISCRATRAKFPIDCTIDTGNTLFSNGGQADGGGLHGFELDNPVITGNVFQVNRSQSEGGGVYLESSTGLTLTGNGFALNTATTGAGLCIKASGALAPAAFANPVNPGLSGGDISITP